MQEQLQKLNVTVDIVVSNNLDYFDDTQGDCSAAQAQDPNPVNPALQTEGAKFS